MLRALGSKFVVGGLRGVTKLNKATMPPTRTIQIPSRNLSNFTDRFKEQAAKALKQGSIATSDVIKNATNKVVNEVSKQVTKGSKVATSVASEALKKSQSAALDAVRSTSSKVSSQVQSATKVTSGVARDQVQSASKAVCDGSKKAVSKTTETSERIRKSTFGVFGNVQETGRKAIRWLWWWSLAAIGVYGVATTIPREFVRYALTGDDSKKENNNLIKNNQEGGENGTMNNGWTHWISDISSGYSKEGVEVDDGKQSNSPLRLPWTHGEDTEKRPVRPSDRWWP
jgi:hypothetical protein